MQIIATDAATIAAYAAAIAAAVVTVIGAVTTSVISILTYLRQAKDKIEVKQTIVDVAAAQDKTAENAAVGVKEDLKLAVEKVNGSVDTAIKAQVGEVLLKHSTVIQENEALKAEVFRLRNVGDK